MFDVLTSPKLQLFTGAGDLFISEDNLTVHAPPSLLFCLPAQGRVFTCLSPLTRI